MIFPDVGGICTLMRPRNHLLDGGPDLSPGGWGNLEGHLPTHYKVSRDYLAYVRYSQPNSVGGSRDTAVAVSTAVLHLVVIVVTGCSRAAGNRHLANRWRHAATSLLRQ